MILVTGGTGLVGAHLLYQLMQKKEKVTAIYRTEKSLEKVKKVFGYYAEEPQLLFERIHWVKADVNDIPQLELAFENVTTVFHVAALVSFDEKDYLKMRKVNIHGTANIVNLCLTYKVEKLLFVSSIATLAKAVTKPYIDETDHFTIETNNYGYAISKFGAEMEVWRGTQEGLPAVIVNPGVIIGPGFWNENSGALFSMVQNKSPFYTEGVTGFVGVDDVVSVLLQAADSNIENERFVLVSESISFQAVLNAIATILQKRKPFIRVNWLIGAIGWRLSWLKSLFGGTHTFTKHTAKSANNKSYYKTEKVEQAFAFRFVPMIEVLEKTASYFKKDKLN